MKKTETDQKQWNVLLDTMTRNRLEWLKTSFGERTLAKAMRRAVAYAFKRRSTQPAREKAIAELYVSAEKVMRLMDGGLPSMPSMVPPPTESAETESA